MNGALFFQLLRFLARQTFISGNTNCCFFLFPELLLYLLLSFQSEPRWFRPPHSLLFHWSVSPSVTRGCCCHRTTFAFPVVRRRRSVKVLEVVARSNNHEQPELSFERASARVSFGSESSRLSSLGHLQSTEQSPSAATTSTRAGVRGAHGARARGSRHDRAAAPKEF